MQCTAVTAAVQMTDRYNFAEWQKVLLLMTTLLTRQERNISAALNVCVWQCRSSEVGQMYCRYMEDSRYADVFPQTVDAACDAKQREPQHCAQAHTSHCFCKDRQAEKMYQQALYVLQLHALHQLFCRLTWITLETCHACTTGNADASM